MDRKLKREEDKIAKKVKKLLYDSGREKDILKTGKLFHRMANILRERNDDKVCYVQSAMLYQACLLRDPSNADEIKSDLQRLCSNVLRKAGVKNRQSNLLDLAEQSKSNVKLFRDNVRSKLNDLPILTDEFRGVELREMEEQKIVHVQALQETVTSEFCAVVSQIISSCQALLGKPPCSFAVVGIGFVARNEVTPYSMFEFMIALERGTKQKFIRSQNYFYWLTTLLTMTLVNLGETEIANGAIPSLKDIKHSPNTGLLDTVAKIGISFPGLMSTPWIMAPNLPFVETLKLTDRSNDAAVRYTMTENLTKTSLVYGDSSIYEDYVNTVCRPIWRSVSQTPPDKLIAQLKSELEIIKPLKCLGSNKIEDTLFDPLFIINQGTPVLTYALGRLYSCKATTNYEVVSELLRNKLIAPNYAHQLRYFISIAIELRLKLCLTDGHRVRENTTDLIPDSELKGLFDAVGKKCLVEYFWIAWCLYKDVSCYFKTGDRRSLSTTSGYLSNYGSIVYAKTCFHLRLYEDCMKHCEMQLRKATGRRNAAYLYLMGGCCYQLGRSSTARNYYEQLVRQLQMTGEKMRNSPSLAYAMVKVGQCSLLMQCPADALPNLTRAHGMYQKQSPVQYDQYAECAVFLSECYLLCDKFNEIMMQLQNPDDDYKTMIVSNKFFAVRIRTIIGLCLTAVERGHLAVGEMEDSIDLANKYANDQFTDPLVAEALDSAGWCFMKMGDWKKAWSFLKQNVGVEERVILSPRYLRSVHVASWLSNIGACLMNLDRRKEAKGYLERANSMRSNASSELRLEPLIAKDLYRIGQILYNQNKSLEALDTLMKVIPYEHTIFSCDPYNLVVIKSYHDMGMILKDLGRWKEAQEKFEKEQILIGRIPKPRSPNPEELAETLQIFFSDYFNNTERRSRAVEKVLQPAMADPKLQQKKYEQKGETLLQIGICLQHDGKYAEAIDLFKKSLKSYHKSSDHVALHNAKGYTHCLTKMGECLFHMERYVEAMMLFNKSLPLSRETTPNPGSDPHVEALHQNIKLCCEKLGQTYEQPTSTPLVNHVQD